MSIIKWLHQPEVEWLGPMPIVTWDDERFGDVGWMPNIEIGLREDGVVVWRKPPESTGQGGKR